MGDTTRRAIPHQKRPPDDNRTPQEIEADLAETRERLAATMDALVQRVQPKELASRGAQRAKLMVMTPDGRLRTKRVVMAVAAVVTVVGGIALLRTSGRRGSAETVPRAFSRSVADAGATATRRRPRGRRSPRCR